MSKRKRQQTPFPQDNDSEGKANAIFERCRDLCKVVLRSWDRGFWTLGEGWWIHMQAIAKEAKAHAHKKEREEHKKRNIEHSTWAEQAVTKGGGPAHRACEVPLDHVNDQAPDDAGEATGCPYTCLLKEVKTWGSTWNQGVDQTSMPRPWQC